MMVWRYRDEMLCKECGEMIRATLDYPLDAPERRDDDIYPQGPYYTGIADGPDHCAIGEDCQNFIELPDGTKIGGWLENELTEEGIEYMRDVVAQGGEIAHLWANFYAASLIDKEADYYYTDEEDCPF